MGDVLNELQERYTESQKESLIGEAYKGKCSLVASYCSYLLKNYCRRHTTAGEVL